MSNKVTEETTKDIDNTLDNLDEEIETASTTTPDFDEIIDVTEIEEDNKLNLKLVPSTRCYGCNKVLDGGAIDQDWTFEHDNGKKILFYICPDDKKISLVSY